ncbi:cysteine repeat modular [Cyclospora cayetanensis]|nr:cysteine repeat modular [Cyclospora cayetanensis]
MYDTRRTFVLPCLTSVNNSAGEKVWESPQVWLPDGTGLWSATIIGGVGGSDKEYATLRVKPSPMDNFTELPQLRNVLACDTTKNQTVLVLGATHMLVLYPESSRSPDIIYHGVPYPADLTIASDQVFITSFDSHLITSFSLSDPQKVIFYEPTRPTLLSAGGIQAVENIDGGETSIFVADTVGGLIGRLKILPEDLQQASNGSTITREWTAIFGEQKSDFRNTEGVNRPFCVGEFVTPYSTQENMNPLLVVGELITDRITFLSMDDNKLSFYRQINLGVSKFITGLRLTNEVLLLTSKQWSVEQELGRAEVAYIKLSQLIDNVYFTYPDFSKKLQAGLRYRFLPLVTGQDIQFFKEDAESGDPLHSMGFTLDSKTGEIEGMLTATVTSRVVIVGGDLLGSYTWSFEFEAGCQSGEYFNDSSNNCEPCPLGTFRDEETELQTCQEHKANSTTLQTGSTNLSQCACVEGYEIGQLGYCQPCPAGTYKAITADAKCTGRCPQHMYSDKTGADSLESLRCQCEPGFYLAESGCQSCEVGTYCAGNMSPPVQCPEYQTTASAASSSPSNCVCTVGYYRSGERCVPCNILTYKPTIGDDACMQCPQPAVSVAQDQKILSSSSPDTSMFSIKKGATQQSECEICASGYYFDFVSMGGCVPCKKDYYCPGFQLGMLACKNQSVTSGIGAETVFQCG